MTSGQNLGCTAWSVSPVLPGGRRCFDGPRAIGLPGTV